MSLKKRTAEAVQDKLKHMAKKVKVSLLGGRDVGLAKAHANPKVVKGKPAQKP